MEDRLTRGFFAGIVGGVVCNAWSMFAGSMGWTTVRTADLIALLVYAHTPPFELNEITFALISHILICGVLGMIFAYWAVQVTSHNLLFKGWIFSGVFFFIAEIVPTMFRIPGTVPTPFNTALCDFVAATIFGLVLPFAFQALTAKENLVSPIIPMAAPAMKPFDYEADDDELD